MRKIFLIIIGVIILLPLNIDASSKEINMHLFYSKSCPHCEDEIKFLNEFLKEKNNIKLYKYEVSENKNNQERFTEARNLLGTDGSGIPYLVIGNQSIVGYYEKYTNQKVKDIIEYYEKNDYRDLVGETFGISEINNDIELVDKDILSTIDLPLIGKINPTKVSLPILAIIIGAVDGFNPCSMWILIFLLTMLINMKNRKRMWTLGLTFIITSGIVYLLFMVSWLNLAVFINKVNYIKLVIGLLGILLGTINIKNYLKERKKADGCEVVNPGRIKKIMLKITKITSEKAFVLALLGIVLLAAAVNIIELLCSLGLPLVFTQLLSLNNLSGIEYFIYLIIYIIFFLIDDFIIFFIAMKSLKVKGISGKYTKYSHLVGGIIMLIIGILMIFKPQWLMFNF